MIGEHCFHRARRWTWTLVTCALVACGDDDGHRVIVDDSADSAPDVPDAPDAPDGEPRENHPPTLSAPADATIAAGALYTARALAEDPDLPDDALAFELGDGPLSLSFDRGNGTLTWAPREADLGPHTIALKVTDREGASATASFTLTVVGPGHAPTISPLDDALVIVGETLVVPLSALDPDGDELAWSLPVAPATLRVDHGDGDRLVWTPTADDVGAHDVLVTVEDPGGLSASAALVVTVRTSGHAPVAVDDYFVTPRGVDTRVAPPLLGNDSDADGDALTPTIVTAPAWGTLTTHPDGAIDYRPGAPVGTPFEPKKAYHFRWLRLADGDLIKWETAGSSVVGDLDGDGTPEIVQVGSPSSGFGNSGWIAVTHANPKTGELEQVWDVHTWTDADPTNSFALAGHPALADFDGDGTLEIVYGSWCKNEIVVLNHDGTTRLSTGVEGCNADYDQDNLLLITDLDADGGAPEILRTVEPPGLPDSLRAYNADGSVRWQVPVPLRANENSTAPLLAADLDLDGRPEIVVAHAVFDADGNLLWNAARLTTEGEAKFAAVANLNDDAFGEVLLTNAKRGIEARTHDGVCLWRTSQTTFADGCPARTMPPEYSQPRSLHVADLDGDGAPEIIATSTRPGVAADSMVVVLDRDGNVEWTRVGVDVGPNKLILSGIAMFDFDGDGVMEVAVGGYGNGPQAQGGLAWLNGKTGETITTLIADAETPGLNPGGGNTQLFHMYVADVDGNGSAELVVDSAGLGGADYAAGMMAYASANVPWQATRPSWGQWSYSVTNSARGGAVLSRPEPNWLTPGLNNYRVNTPLPTEAGATDAFTYTVSDGTLTSNKATVHLDIHRANAPPFILGPLRTVVGVGETYAQPLRAVDTDAGDVVSVSLDVGPEGMVLGDDRVLYWETTADDLGEHEVIVSAWDLEGGSDVETFTLRVVEPQPVPDVVGEPLAEADALVTGADFLVGRVTRHDHPTIPEGAVAEQDPAAGAPAVPGSKVNLVVSTGPGPADRDDDGDGFTPNQGDCDDAAEATHRGADDPAADGVDQDCDGVDGSAVVVSIVVEPTSLELLVGERRSLRAFGVFADGSAQEITAAVEWSVTGPLTVDQLGRIAATGAGAATVTATRGAAVGSVPVAITAIDGSDEVPAIAVIASPGEGETVTGVSDVIGTADDARFVRYDLQLAPADTRDWTTIASGAEPVRAGALGRLDTTGLVNGPYVLRLAVVDVSGRVVMDERAIVVDGDQKVGLFTLAFDDLVVPLGGLPIQITRSYDSRDKRQGDFGVGWRLSLASVAVRCGEVLGEGWYSARGGLAWQLVGERAHSCAVELPGGRVETFDFEPSPKVSPVVPFLFVNASFKPRGGATGKLTSVDNPHLMITDPQPGEVVLVDDTTFEPYDPQEFRYTTPDGTVFAIGPDGLESVTDANGNRLVIGPDGIEGPEGIGVDLTRDGLGRITAITDPMGATQRYAYNGSGDLVAHSDALGHTTRYFYNRDHDLVRVEDPLGRPVVRTEYDADGRVVAAVDALGNRTSYVYDDVAKTTTTTFPDGSVRVMSYDDEGHVLTRATSGDGADGVERYAYDERGNVTAKTDPDGVSEQRTFAGDRMTSRVIDPDGLAITESVVVEDGRVTSSTDGEGRTTTFGYDARGNANRATLANGATMGITVDARGLPTAVVSANGERVESTYDRAGRLASRRTIGADGVPVTRSEYTWDAGGRLLERREIDVTDATRVRKTTWRYDALGRRVAEVDALGGETTWEYDAAGQLVATSVRGRRTAMAYDAAGHLVERTHPDGGVERFEVDYAGRVTQETDPAGVVTTHTWDGNGQRTSTRRAGALVSELTYTPGGRVASYRDPDGTIDYEYDGAGRLVAVRLPEVADADGARRRPTIRYELDKSGRRTAEIDANGLRTETDYDAGGSVAVMRQADGSEVRFEYDAGGRLLARRDEDGDETRFTWDAGGHLTAVTEPAAADGVAPAVTRLVYDGWGQLRARIDALGRTVAFDYDELGRETRRVRPDGRAQVREYDAVGDLVRWVDFDGTAVTFAYDAAGRWVSRAAAGLSEAIAWRPDGQRASQTDARGTTTFEYDDAGRLSAIVAPDGAELGYRWDAMGRVAEVSAQGDVVGYRWDANGRLVEVQSADGATTYGYDLGGRLVAMVQPNGVETAVAYDERGHVVERVERVGGVERERWSATYAPDGKRTSLTGGGATETYDYDGVGRLVRAVREGRAPFDVAFEYDAVGNRTRMVRDGVTTDYARGPNHELIAATGGDAASYRYDERGNRIGDGARYFAWDAVNRLVSADAVAYGYDPEDRRVSRSEGGATTAFLVDARSPSGVPQTVEEHDADGDTLASWRYGAGPLSQARGGVVSYYGLDPHGSVRTLAGGDGAVTDRYDYLPYGEPLATEGTTDNPLRAHGERWDAGLYDLRARPYDAATGEFLARDKFDGDSARPASLQPYQYADRDPIGNVDPLGLFTLPEITITMDIELKLDFINIGNATSAFCEADATLTALMYAVRAADIAVYLYNVSQSGIALKSRHLKAEFELPKDSKFSVSVSPFLRDGSLGAEIGFDLEKAPGKLSAAVTWYRGKWEPKVFSGAAYVGLSFCGFEVARVGLGDEHSFATGHGNMHLLLEMSKSEDDHVESGGLKWPLLSW